MDSFFTKLVKVFELCEGDNNVKTYVRDYLSTCNDPTEAFIKYGKDNIGGLKSSTIAYIGELIGLLKDDPVLFNGLRKMYEKTKS